MKVQRTNSNQPRHTLWAALLFYFVHLTGAFAQNATATVNFDQLSGRTINKGAFGLNLFQGFDPNQAGNPGNATYKDAMAFMKPGIVRYHSWEMMGLPTSNNGWLSSANTWDAAKINNALTGAYAYGPTVLMNIPGWPSAWADAGGKLLPARYTDFANLCASLVRIINVNQGRGIKYWEVTNERDDVYGLQSDELGRIYNQAVAAMKAVDNTILTGGPAFARPDLTAQVNAFFSTAAPNLDFVTYHSYATGTASAPTQQVYDLAAYGGGITASIRTEFAKHSTRTVEYFHDEYNISWNPPDPHQSSYVSMIFDAVFTITAIKSGATGTMAWNECDGWYGKMDNSYNKRPSAYLFHNLNNALPGGSVCNSTVSNAASLVVLASQKGSLRQLVVVNRSDVDQRYKFTFTGLPAGVNNATLFASSQNVPTGGIVTKDITYGELTGGTGALFGKNTVSILSIDVNNLRSTASGFSGTYKITARHSGKALDVSNSSTADGANVQQWTDNGSQAQQWIITPTTNGYYKLVCKASGKALDVNASSLADGANVHQWTYVGGNNQQWLIEPTSDGYYRLIARHSGKALDVNGGSGATQDGANVHQWGYVGGTNQQWKLDLLSTATSRLAAESVRPGAVRLYPNPVTGGVLHVQVPQEGNQTVRVHISNGLSQRVLTLERAVPAGTDLRIPVGGLRKGVYVATVVTGSGSSVVKFVVQ
ncbi:MAG: CBM13 / GH5_35 / PL3_4 / GH39 [uncultured Cytophagales bacterium]|uniref:CBM13 / GH5_35 / PL3_4 / GH39 n=1 Tax=uncultured Cytophagales bacterium TaxID=158755 RepID=A0A6J4IV23_9SPHI|nr:MAG: CBM13 / GH5_35 / PL3_4 / GH39 [uncultured Cytophagales bacterium]